MGKYKITYTIPRNNQNKIECLVVLHLNMTLFRANANVLPLTQKSSVE